MKFLELRVLSLDDHRIESYTSINQNSSLLVTVNVLLIGVIVIVIVVIIIISSNCTSSSSILFEKNLLGWA
jgi:hypothetical protein